MHVPSMAENAAAPMIHLLHSPMASVYRLTIPAANAAVPSGSAVPSVYNTSAPSPRNMMASSPDAM